MIKKAAPILTSLLDTDAYKLHMQQAVYHHYQNITVTAEFRCRSEDNLGEYSTEIIEQINLMSELSLTKKEFDYLASLPFFKDDYLAWLKTFRFNPSQVNVFNNKGKLTIQINGLWLDIILWEVPLLAVISEVVHRHRSPHITSDDALAQLHYKLDHLKKISGNLDLSSFNVVDFGTRRRFSKQVHQTIIETLKEHAPFFVGTSNYAFAQHFDLPPVGTQAHEWFQAHQQITPHLADSQKEALTVWLKEYPHYLDIALTDCISMDAFLRDFTYPFAQAYQGLRHDSGDPFTWGEKAIKHYQLLNIDPLEKLLVFSDSLDFPMALDLYRHFKDRIQLAFGIGTRLTCDIPNIKPLNIVIKLISCNGKPVAKLSDSPGKTICEDPRFVKKLRKTFGVVS